MLDARIALATPSHRGPSTRPEPWTHFLVRRPRRPSRQPPTRAPEVKHEPGSDPDSLPQPQYSIAAVSKLSGISCHTLRVWERRYGFPVPFRSPAGHRRYDRTQVQTLCHLSQLARASGQPIGELISLLNEGRLELGATPSPQPSPAADDTIAELIARLLAGDNEGADREYSRLSGRFDSFGVAERVDLPWTGRGRGRVVSPQLPGVQGAPDHRLPEAKAVQSDRAWRGPPTLDRR